MKDELRIQIGKDTAKFLREILPSGLNMRKAYRALNKGDFEAARDAASQALVSAYSANFFARDPCTVAEKLCGGLISYIHSKSKADSVFVTGTVAFTDVREGCEDLFVAEPGTVGLFHSPRRGGYSALLIAAHEAGSPGVVSFERGTLQERTLSMTAIAELLDAREQAGTNVVTGSSKLIVAPHAGAIGPYAVDRELKNNATYFTLRKR